MTENESLPITRIAPMIHTIRNQKVILDADLARLYGVATKRLKEQVKRNADRFPADFAFVLARQEVTTLRSQIATSNNGRGGARYLPIAFTEHGAIMAATVLNSPKAVEMSVFVVRAFVRMRQEFASRRDMEQRLDQIEKILLVHDSQLQELFDKIRPLLLPPSETPGKQVGFSVRERRAKYGTSRRKRKTNT